MRILQPDVAQLLRGCTAAVFCSPFLVRVPHLGFVFQYSNGVGCSSVDQSPGFVQPIALGLDIRYELDLSYEALITVVSG